MFNDILQFSFLKEKFKKNTFIISEKLSGKVINSLLLKKNNINSNTFIIIHKRLCYKLLFCIIYIFRK